MENTLTRVGPDPNGPSRDDSNVFHIVGVHDQRADERLVFGVVLANVNLLALLRRATRIHDEAPGRHHANPRRWTVTMEFGPACTGAAGDDTEIDSLEIALLTS
jgi:hypothetical protein